MKSIDRRVICTNSYIYCTPPPSLYHAHICPCSRACRYCTGILATVLPPDSHCRQRTISDGNNAPEFCCDKVKR